MVSIEHIAAQLRAFRLPHLLVAILGLMYRYLFVLVDEAQRLQRARLCRSASLDGRGGSRWRAATGADGGHAAGAGVLLVLIVLQAYVG